jgi:hypothetical protein
MGLFDSLLGRKPSAPPPSPLRELLFGDALMSQWPRETDGGQQFPWTAFVEARARIAKGDRAGAIERWKAVADHEGLESRQYLQAWTFLRQQGVQPPAEIATRVLGTVLEVGMREGLDVLAAYEDHTARYLNHSGAAVIWEHPDDSLDPLIDELLRASASVVARIGPWKEARRPPPARDDVRMSFLTPSGLHFGEGPFALLSEDAMGSPVIQRATALMIALTQKGAAHA